MCNDVILPFLWTWWACVASILTLIGPNLFSSLNLREIDEIALHDGMCAVGCAVSVSLPFFIAILKEEFDVRAAMSRRTKDRLV